MAKIDLKQDEGKERLYWPAGSWTLLIPVGPFQLRVFYDSIQDLKLICREA